MLLCVDVRKPMMGTDGIDLPKLGALAVRFLARFADHTDPELPYMFHCHLLRHEDNGMMGQFVVVQPGQAPASPPAHQGHQ